MFKHAKPFNCARPAEGVARVRRFRGSQLKRSWLAALSIWIVALSLLLAAGRGWAMDTNNTRNLADLTLEQLMNETVTSVSKKEQRLGDAAAAIGVLSNEDLQRMGATSIPEALRWMPGMNVGAVNASDWAVSSRGFNGLYANKLLVLVDGRAVYTPIFAGVYWNLQQSMLSDLDRIEVIRGPGAAVWGANAVNGVINVVSRNARETQGGLVYAGGGDVRQAFGGARYGGQINSNTFFRVFGSYQLTDDYPLPTGGSASDAWSTWHGGFRMDHFADEKTHVTWQADATQADLDAKNSDAYNVNTLGRWTRELTDRSSFEVQSYYDRTYRDDITRVESAVDTIDLTAQHTFGLGEQNDIIWGLGYRYIGTRVEQTTPQITLTDRSLAQNLVSAFIQDEWKPVPDILTVTLGTKLEHNDFTGWEIQPSLRTTFKVAENQTLWAAISRAVRTPSEVEGISFGSISARGSFVGPGGFTYLPTVVGNPDAKAEILMAYEVGYRSQPSSWLNVELNAFYNDYDRLITIGPVTQLIPGTPVRVIMPFGNYQTGNTYGGEALLTIAASESWRLTAGYSLLIASIHGDPSTTPEQAEHSSPQNQVTLRSAHNFSDRISLDLQCRYVDSIRSVPSYITADFRLSYRPTDRWEISVVGQNLLDKSHPEHFQEALTVGAEVPRSYYGKITWRF